jgi:hypothetical protein
MKKIDRLRWIEKTFGQEFVLPYFFCHNWEEILEAINTFESSGKTWGLRTDICGSETPGQTQGILYPFLFQGSVDGAKKLWKENGEKLHYLVSLNILEVTCHGVAELLDPEHIFIEFNDKEPFISLRDMYNNMENVRRIGVGPSAFITRWETVVRCFHPEEVSIYRFDDLYRLMVSTKLVEKTIEFTITDVPKRIIIW